MDSHDTEQMRLAALLTDVSERDARIGPPVRVEDAVMARWAERHSETSVSMDAAPLSASPGPRMLAWLGLTGAAAALVLVAWGFKGPVDSSAPHASAIHENPLVQDEPRDAPAPIPTRSEPVIAREETPAVGRPNVQPRTNPARPVPTDVEPFVRLLPMTDQELAGIRLARVRMRGQAAQTLGLDLRIPAPGADGFVEADVLLGEDGLARAIRFVR